MSKLLIYFIETVYEIYCFKNVSQNRNGFLQYRSIWIKKFDLKLKSLCTSSEEAVAAAPSPITSMEIGRC